MREKKGANIKDLKQQNRALVLRNIAVGNGQSRVDLARITGLSKMAVGNLVTDLLQMGLIEECEVQLDSVIYGRRPIMLKISRRSPCICGMLIKRRLFQVVLADLSGQVIEKKEIPFHENLSREEIPGKLLAAFEELRRNTERRIIAIGVSSVGPLDAEKGIILNPPLFYGIENLHIVEILEQKTALPVFLINDANAGALAEKLYGTRKNISNFLYLHIMNGIGAGYMLDHHLYCGDSGQSGEIGHTSINFMGPKCGCGNVGCLELYASVERMQKRIGELLPLYQGSQLERFQSVEDITWTDIVDSANRKDALAITVLEQFCGYVGQALTNTLNLLDISCVIVGYDSRVEGNIVERLLTQKISSAVLYSRYRKVYITHSSFGGDAPLVGAIACVAEKVFNLSLPLLLDETPVKED